MTSHDSEIGSLAIEKNWITPEQLNECREAQDAAAKLGVQGRLLDIMVQRGVLSQDQANKLERAAAGQSHKIEGYHLLTKIGAGGMGAVYKARQEGMNREVALKILPPKFASNQTFLDRFYREAQSMAKLQHPNIVMAYDVGESNGYHYLAMEYVEGEDLQARLKREKALPEDQALNIAIYLARALEYAGREASLIHRDIKPGNILLTMDGTVKLADLGLAKQTTNEEKTITQAGAAVGSPHYMSPEQIRGEQDLDCRTDIYSLGVCLFHLLTGRPPYFGESYGTVLSKHLSEELPDIRETNPEISENLSLIFQRMTRTERDGRYSDWGEVVKDLELATAGESPAIARPMPSVVSSTRARRERPTSRRSPRPAVAGATAVLAVVLIVFLIRGKDEPSADKSKQPGSETSAAMTKSKEAGGQVAEPPEPEVPLPEKEPPSQEVDQKPPETVPVQVTVPVTKTATVDKKPEPPDGEEESRLLQQATSLRQKLWKELVDPLKKRRYGESLQAVAGASEKTGNPTLKPLLNKDREVINAAQSLFQRAKARAADQIGRQFGTGSMAGEVTSVDEERITLKIGAGEVGRRFETLAEKEILQLAGRPEEVATLNGMSLPAFQLFEGNREAANESIARLPDSPEAQHLRGLSDLLEGLDRETVAEQRPVEWKAFKLKFISLKGSQYLTPGKFTVVHRIVALPNGRGFLPFPTKNGKGILAAADGQSLRIDVNQNGRLDDDRVILREGVVNLKLTLGQDKWSYAAHVAVRGRNIQLRRAGAMSGEILGKKIVLLDDNNNGRYDDYLADAAVIGSTNYGAYMSRVIPIGNRLYEFKASPSGTTASVRPFTGKPARIRFEHRSILRSVVVTGDKTSFQVAGSKGTPVPAGSYKFAFGYVEKGKMRAFIQKGNMKPIQVAAGKTVKVDWGPPCRIDFNTKAIGGNKFNLLVPRILGVGGEEYYGFQPKPSRYDIAIYDSSGKRVSAAGMAWSAPGGG